jgi:hypothetical protein
VPIVEPSTRSCRKNSRLRSADGSAPVVAPGDDERARPGAGSSSSATRWPCRPSRDASTRAGSRRTGSNTSCAPARAPAAAWSRRARSPRRRGPAARASAMAAVETPATGALHQHAVTRADPGLREEHPVGVQPGGRQAGRLLEDSSAGLGTGCGAGRRPARRRCPGSARTGCCASGRASRRRSSRGRRRSRGTTTSSPSSVTPGGVAAEHHRQRSAGRPTPRRLHRSWWFRLAARTVTRAQPSGASGSGRSPTVRPDSGSSADWDVQVAASMDRQYEVPGPLPRSP